VENNDFGSVRRDKLSLITLSKRFFLQNLINFTVSTFNSHTFTRTNKRAKLETPGKLSSASPRIPRI